MRQIQPLQPTLESCANDDVKAPLPTPSHPLLDRLWEGYVADVPDARTFCDLHAKRDTRPFENDHIALRTVANNGEGSGIAGFAGVFERLGWDTREHYVFPDIHLRAIYMGKRGLPRVFISELDPSAMPVDTRAALARLTTLTPPDDVEGLAAWFCAPAPPQRVDVDSVARASQYAAWLLCFDRRVNHFTAAVDDVAAWQARLIAAGVRMKDEIEGAVLGERAVGLRQTATAAAKVPVTFADGSVGEQPYAYFEIAERRGGFDGFLAQQARQLFEQTRG